MPDVVLHERDVYRKFVVALDELDRSVERIYEPVELPVAAFVVAHLTPLLRKDRNARRTEVFADRLVCQTVRYRDRRMVRFEADVVIVAVLVYAHDRRPGPDRRIEERRQQIHAHLIIYHRSPCLKFRNLLFHRKGSKNLSYKRTISPTYFAPCRFGTTSEEKRTTPQGRPRPAAQNRAKRPEPIFFVLSPCSSANYPYICTPNYVSTHNHRF